MKNPNTCGYVVYCADIPICRLECKPCIKTQCPVEKSENRFEMFIQSIKDAQERKDGEVK